MLKGYQGWAGRALIGLKALALCKNMLQGYKIVIYSMQSGAGLEEAIDDLVAKTGVCVKILPAHHPHLKMLDLHAHARIFIGLSMSDGASVSMLEAMAMGSFPIQSGTSCASEWIKDSETGFIVPPEDVQAAAKAIQKALKDDQLINRASKLNWVTVKQRLNQVKLKQEAINLYQNVYKNSKTNNHQVVLDDKDQKNNVKELIFKIIIVLWLIVVISIWCYLLVIYGIQKLHLFDVNIPFQNLTGEGGAWLWGSDWPKYLLFKK